MIMTKTEDGGLLLNAQEVVGVMSLLLAEQKHVVDIHATTSQDITTLVNGWEEVFGPLES
jgi:anti-sigma-K factor RskA